MDKSERFEYGYKIMKSHLGDATDAWLKKLEKAKLFVRVNVECAFGDIYGDPDSSLNDKTSVFIVWRLTGAVDIIDRSLRPTNDI